MERVEKLEVQPNGGLAAELEYRADGAEEIDEGDAMPILVEGWIGERKENVNTEGKAEVRLVAVNAWPAKHALPENHAEKGDWKAGCYLQFPTKVKAEKRGKATYYHFSRRYGAREAAKVDYYYQTLVTDKLDGLAGLNTGELQADERIQVVQALAEFETAKDLLFAREAFRAVTPEGRQDGWLAAWRAGWDFMREQDYAALSTLLEPVQQGGNEGRQRRIEAETEKFEQGLMGAVREQLREAAGYDGGQISAFEAEYGLRKLAWEVTQDLGDEQFRISVKMPGRIVGSNADRVDGDTASWEFTGVMLKDREIELLVSSVVEETR